MKYTSKRWISKPFLNSKNAMITEVNNDFINFTGYSREEVIGKSLAEMGAMLKLGSQINLQDIERNCRCFIFTKTFDPREVDIFCEDSEGEEQKIFCFVATPSSNMEDKFEFIERLYFDSKTGVALCNFPDLILLKANQNYINLLYTLDNRLESCIGKQLSEIIVNYEKNNIAKAWDDVIKKGKALYQEEFEYDYSRGVSYWNSSLMPIYIEGKLKYIIQTTLDVTEKVKQRKLMEQQSKIIQEQKLELEAVIENMSDDLVIFDKDGNYTKFNKAARENFIYNTSKLKNIEDFYEQVEQYDMKGNLLSKENIFGQKVLRGEKFSGCRVLQKNSKGKNYRELSGSPIFDDKENFIAGVIVGRDINDKVMKEENLLIETQYNLLYKMIENLELGFVRCTYPDYIIIDINYEAYNSFKKLYPKIRPILEVKGQNFFDIYKVDNKNELIMGIKNAIEKDGKSYFTHAKFIIGGEEKYYKVMYQPLLGLNNQIREIIIVGIDMTLEVRAKNQVEATLKMQDELFVNISHELKTPLNVIFSMTQLFEQYLINDTIMDSKSKIMKSICVLKQNCCRLTRLINNIVDISKLESGYFELDLCNVNVVNIVEGIVQSVADYVQRKGLTIIFDTNTEEKIIACDPHKIERILLNLISNAIKFSDSGKEILVSVIDKGETVEISVKDNGIGIDKKHLDTIFDRFHQVDKSLSRNAEGSGIGLYIVKSIVELHGGKISAESTKGEGSIFRMEFPSRTIDQSELTPETMLKNNRIDMINAEFSDIYSI